MTDRTGQQFGNYHLMRLLGRGGFAEVYLGEHRRLRTHAAIKVLRAQLQGEDTDAFLAEAQTIARLEHPHVIRVIDFDIADGIPFLVMSYAPGGTLRERHKRGKSVPLALVVSYVKEIAEALQYAHSEKVIHRDVKPENMLLGRHDEVILSDFGIATLAYSSYSIQTQDVAGTISYMAPEQIRAHPRYASDQYALAVVVYEWLCGMPPFEGTYYELMSKHIDVPPPPLRSSTQILPDEIEQVIFTALAKDPKQRFDNVRTFALELERTGKSENTFFMGMQLDSSSFYTHITSSVITDRSLRGIKNRSDTLHMEQDPNSVVRQLEVPKRADYNTYNRKPVPISVPKRRSLVSSQKNILERRRVISLLATGGVIAVGSALVVITNISHVTIPPHSTPTVHNTNKSPTKEMTQILQPVHIGPAIGMTTQEPNSAKTFKNSGDDNDSLLVRLPDGTFVAYERACTHQQVPVNYHPDTHTFVCPLHGSVFDPAQNGKVLQGPANAPLPPVKVSVNGDGTITVV